MLTQQNHIKQIIKNRRFIKHNDIRPGTLISGYEVTGYLEDLTLSEVNSVSVIGSFVDPCTLEPIYLVEIDEDNQTLILGSHISSITEDTENSNTKYKLFDKKCKSPLLDAPFVTINGQIVNVPKLKDRCITTEDFISCTYNKMGIKYVVPCLTDDALIYATKNGSLDIIDLLDDEVLKRYEILIH